jgi:lipid-binding SYLF domain-containing protein
MDKRQLSCYKMLKIVFSSTGGFAMNSIILVKNAMWTATASVLLISNVVADPTSAECRESVESFKSLSANVATLVSSAYGYAVFPNIGKGGLVIGGAGGAGCVYQGGAQTGTSKMGQVTIGFQAGGQVYSQIIMFQNTDSYTAFTADEFEFGAQATAVALTASAQAEAGSKGSSAAVGATDQKGGGKSTTYTDGMAVYTVAKGGLMYEASIGGQKFSYKPL